MKKLQLSIAALALILAIAGTATANANTKEAEPCSKKDPKQVICINGSDEPCCEDDGGNTFFYP